MPAEQRPTLVLLSFEAVEPRNQLVVDKASMILHRIAKGVAMKSHAAVLVLSSHPTRDELLSLERAMDASGVDWTCTQP